MRRRAGDYLPGMRGSLVGLPKSCHQEKVATYQAPGEELPICSNNVFDEEASLVQPLNWGMILVVFPESLRGHVPSGRGVR